MPACIWFREPEDDTYESGCGHSFYFVDGILAEQNGFKFCPYCGNEINANEPTED